VPVPPHPAGKQLGNRALEATAHAGSAAVETARDVRDAAKRRVSDVRKRVATTTSATVAGVSTTVRDVGHVAATGVQYAAGKVQSARLRVRRYLKHGWTVDPDQAAPLSPDDQDQYQALLHFERAAEIDILPGAKERLPFVVPPGATVEWEFRVKV
jgi:hypothetical protein